MSLCEILLMVSISSEKSIIPGKNLSPFHGLDFIRMIHEKSHAQAENLASCHEMGKSFVFLRNRRIPEKIRFLTLILQGGIAYFAIFLTRFRFSQEIARNEKKSVVLPDLRRDLGFPKKSLILRNNLSPFHEMLFNRMISKKSHDSSFELMYSKCVGIICYVLRKFKYSMLRIIV